MLEAIDRARESVCLETYIYASGALGERFLDKLVGARQRGARVQVLIDGLGSYGLSESFWKPLRDAGGEVRQFNPISLHRWGIRDHRKLLVCDQGIAFVGGFNIAPEYEGDGVNCGWCDIGLRIEGALVSRLAAAFDEMFARAEFQHKRFMRLRPITASKSILTPQEQVLLSGPGRRRNPIRRALGADLGRARSVQIMVAYFLPSWRIRRQLMRVIRQGGRVQLILAGKSDITISRLAAQNLYRRLLRGGVEIHEYQPQVLHAKLIIIDGIVYIGSANLDHRSLSINYELMVRFETKDFAQKAREVFNANLKESRGVTLNDWKELSFWRRFKQSWAYFLLVRIDPWIARWQWRALQD